MGLRPEGQKDNRWGGRPSSQHVQGLGRGLWRSGPRARGAQALRGPRSPAASAPVAAHGEPTAVFQKPGALCVLSLRSPCRHFFRHLCVPSDTLIRTAEIERPRPGPQRPSMEGLTASLCQASESERGAIRPLRPFSLA